MQVNSSPQIKDSSQVSPQHHYHLQTQTSQNISPSSYKLKFLHSRQQSSELNIELKNINEDVVQTSLLSQSEIDSPYPILLQCDYCRTYCYTDISYQYTKFTYLSVFILIFCLLCWVPLLFKNYFQKTIHHCQGCQRVVGTYVYFKQNK